MLPGKLLPCAKIQAIKIGMKMEIIRFAAGISIQQKRKLIAVRHPRSLKCICYNHLRLGAHLLVVVGKKLRCILRNFLASVFHIESGSSIGFVVQSKRRNNLAAGRSKLFVNRVAAFCFVGFYKNLKLFNFRLNGRDSFLVVIILDKSTGKLFL
mgnify:CR=1 FL=1